MAGWRGIYRSSIVKKALMALSGLALFGFVLGHMAGNLKLYQGADKFNAYAEWLRELGYPALPHSGALWIARVALLAAVGIHILAAWQVSREAARARRTNYAQRKTLAATYASRTMRWGGVLILLFVLYHLAHLTFGWRFAHPDFVLGDPFHNVVAGFGVWWVSAFYVAANLALGMHLYHGLWSLFQSLGLNHDSYNALRRRFAVVFAVVVTLGNVSFPVSVLTGLVG